MTHLTDAQCMSYLAAEEDAATRAHLASCETCRREVERIVKLAGEAKSAFAAVSDCPAAFWTRQRASAASRVSARSPRIWRFASALAFVLLVALLMFQFHRPAPHRPDAGAVTTVSDDALLSAVQNTLQQQLPDALEPAQLLVSQRQLAENSDTNSTAITRR
ncbi:MAG: anti-sigma factor family protein [Terriglobales bacterium]